MSHERVVHVDKLVVRGTELGLGDGDALRAELGRQLNTPLRAESAGGPVAVERLEAGRVSHPATVHDIAAAVADGIARVVADGRGT